MNLINKIYALATSAIVASTSGALISYGNRVTVVVKKPELIEQKSEGSFLKNAFCCGGEGDLI